MCGGIPNFIKFKGKLFGLYHTRRSHFQVKNFFSFIFLLRPFRQVLRCVCFRFGCTYLELLITAILFTYTLNPIKKRNGVEYKIFNSVSKL